MKVLSNGSEFSAADKVAIVTGAGRGIGRATAVLFREHGVHVGLVARSEEELRSVADTATDGQTRAVVLPADVSDENQVEQAISRALKEFGRIDFLINNAAIGDWCPVEAYDVESWDRIMAVNLRGVFLCSRAVIPSMSSRGSGHIVNISSGAGRRGLKNRAAYSASKFGVMGFSESLELEVAERGIKVTVVLPGEVSTSFTSHYPSEVPRPDPKHALSPEDVAEAILAVVTTGPRVRIADLAIRPL